MNELSIFKCLADPTRLAVMKTLRRGERSVGELVKATKMEQTNLSHHLAQLRACGMVESRHEGKKVLYRIAHAGLGSLLTEAEGVGEHIQCDDPKACAEAGRCE